jgi:hypothetical protein
MIYQNSRYYHQTIDFVSFKENGDAKPIVFYEFDVPGKISWWEHIYVDGERLEAIAYRYYKRCDYWWLIPEYNPEISDFTNIKPGTVLKVPHV